MEERYATSEVPEDILCDLRQVHASLSFTSSLLISYTVLGG